ncbi:MAG: Rha family transcriptional regulator [Methylocystis silviterrae]|uniref:Rha family transcriptional regulator n=1 Tax=Methylocystis silviterrae TaxID=2743612 RepID=UPI003C717435
MSEDQVNANGAQNKTLPAESLVSAAAGKAIADSRLVAERFGKDHKHVLRDIDRLVTRLSRPDDAMAQNWAMGIAEKRIAHPTVAGRFDRYYELDRDAFVLIVMGFTGEEAIQWKIKYLQAFNAMEAKLGIRRIEGSQQGNNNIPYTPSRKHPFLLTECCEALGISEATAAGRIPDLQITTLIIEAGEEQIERRVITEAALYFLAFARRTLAPNQIGSKEEHKNAEDWVQIPKRNVGRFILTIHQDGAHHLYRSDFEHIGDEADQLNCLGASHSIKTVEAFFLRLQQLFEIGIDPKGSQLLQGLEEAVFSAALHANHFIDVYTNPPREFSDLKPTPRPSRQPAGNGQSR